MKLNIKSLILAALVTTTTFMTTINFGNVGKPSATIGGEQAQAVDFGYIAALLANRFGSVAFFTPMGRALIASGSFAWQMNKLTIVDHQWMKNTLNYDRDYDYMAQDFENRTGWKRVFKNVRGYWVYMRP